MWSLSYLRHYRSTRLFEELRSDAKYGSLSLPIPHLPLSFLNVCHKAFTVFFSLSTDIRKGRITRAEDHGRWRLCTSISSRVSRLSPKTLLKLPKEKRKYVTLPPFMTGSRILVSLLLENSTRTCSKLLPHVVSQSKRPSFSQQMKITCLWMSQVSQLFFDHNCTNIMWCLLSNTFCHFPGFDGLAFSGSSFSVYDDVPGIVLVAFRCFSLLFVAFRCFLF